MGFLTLRGTKMTHRKVRRASIEDVAALTEIRNDAHRKKVGYGDYVWGKEGDGFSERWVLDHVAKREVYLVEEAELAVATFTLDFGPDPHWEGHDLAAGYVHGLCVRDGFNGQGLGSFMLGWSANKIRDMNRRYIRLDCALGNKTLCSYYESLGFVQAGIKREEIAWALYERLVQ